MHSICRWVKSRKTDKLSVKNDSDRPEASVTKANIDVVKAVVLEDGLVFVKEIWSGTGITEGNVKKNHLHLRKIWDGCEPHSLTDAKELNI